MDNVTHIFLGGIVAQAMVGPQVGLRRAFLVGALAATIPDLDVFIRAGDALRDHALHRHFTHALILTPMLAALALVPFLWPRKSRPPVWPLFLGAWAACMSHTLLDTLTSYGTMIFWPFTERRYALDVIAVVDPLYTLPLIVGGVWAMKRKVVAPAVAGLFLSCGYVGLAQRQQARAAAAQRELLAARHLEGAENPRVLPQVGAVVSFRSIYIVGGQIHVDAIRVPFLGGTSYKAGGTLPLATAADLREPKTPRAAEDFALFVQTADGFVARSPADPLLFSDLRYAFTPEGLELVWGMQLEETQTPQFRITPRWDYLGTLFQDLFRPRGYAAIPAGADR